MADEQVPPATVSGTELARAWFANSPFTRQLGLRIVELTADGAELVMPFDPAHTTQADIIHGGAISTLVDVAATAAAWSTIEAVSIPRGATVSLSLQFVAAGQGDLRARAHPLRRGASLHFLDVTVTDTAETLIAKALVTYKIG